jgi:hypothetical protein
MRLFRQRDACARVRPALTDWVEHRIQGPLTPAAFDHLDRCRRCELELTDVAQTVIALRRLAELAAAIDAPTDGWPDLRARLEESRRRSRPSFRSRWALLGSMLGPAVVAVLAIRMVVAAPLGTVWSDDGSAERSASTRVVRPMYDSGSRPLTEDIVTILASRATAGDGGSTWLATVPSSTDRRDTPAAPRRAAPRSESTLPRSATRS